MTGPGTEHTSCAEINEFWGRHRPDLVRDYVSGKSSFIASLLPPTALELSVADVIRILRDAHGDRIETALERSPDGAADTLPSEDDWMHRANVVGINVRTVGSFWRVLHYCLTLPGAFDAVHLLPIWEPGVVGSLYGMASWEINDEFIDPELAALYPGLNTAADQLRATIAVLHACGRKVGMDVIPHTDRFSQMVLAQPAMFEWLRRNGKSIVDHRADLHEEVEDLVYEFARDNGPAEGQKAGPIPPRRLLFSEEVPEDDRNRLLFGLPEDRDARNARRLALIRFISSRGYEPVPATMGPPYRGIEVDPDSGTVDGSGHVWLDYRITRPQPMSRVFGPLTRYKLYERLDDNRRWEIDFARPRQAVWDYVASHYRAVQNRFGFDFMRGDMSHVQMRPDGVPADVPVHYDILGFVKETIRRDVPSFPYFAETFLAPPGVMAFGDECDHLEACGAEATLGDLQSVAVATEEFARRLRYYLDLARTRSFTPSFTVLTGDKDDPRFDSFYLNGNELRLFCAVFIPDLPSYTALGFELRDPHPTPAANEYYSKLYVFQVRTGRHATTGPYRFGGNAPLFLRLQRILRFAGELAGESGPGTQTGSAIWLLPPDPTGGRRVIAWSAGPPGGTGDAGYRVFVANCDTESPALNVKVPLAACCGGMHSVAGVRCRFQTVPDRHAEPAVPAGNGFHIPRLGRGECRVYDASVRHQQA